VKPSDETPWTPCDDVVVPVNLPRCIDNQCQSPTHIEDGHEMIIGVRFLPTFPAALCLEPSESGRLRRSGRTAGRSVSTFLENDQQKPRDSGFIETFGGEGFHEA
jgi:hypothetical protein